MLMAFTTSYKLYDCIHTLKFLLAKKVMSLRNSNFVILFVYLVVMFHVN